jgi:hypothetical protein
MRQGKATPEDLPSENKTYREISMASSRLINAGTSIGLFFLF